MQAKRYNDIGINGSYLFNEMFKISIAFKYIKAFYVIEPDVNKVYTIGLH